MRSVFTCTIVIVVSSAFAQRPFAHHAENFRKAVPHHNHHDQENFDRRMDKIARWHKIEPHQPPLRPHQTVPWLRWVHEGRWAAQANKNTELHKVRARLLEEKLRPNHLAFKPRINPQLKPRLKKENARTKRETEKSENENVQKETEIEVNVRHKRDIRMAQQVPEIIMKSYPDAEMPQASDQFHGRVKELEKRGKRQVVYFINRPPQQLARSPRTTPNPFIRDTHIDDYDIIRPEVGEREGMIPTIESGSSDLGSYPLMKIPQALIRFLQIAKTKLEQSYLVNTKSNTNKSNNIKEDAHVRVKRRMSRFIRDRKQMTRKKKIGRAKKTKVKRTPIKLRKWYDKRQKVKKKGDGTYRGGRGRKPRQHKRPRHYKPPMNETSDYDYYDSKGGIRGEEKQEGPDVADYLSYVSGEYSDTEEAERAHQELEKEYQEQLKRERLREKRRKLSNGTIEISEEPYLEPYSESSKSKEDSEAVTQERVSEKGKIKVIKGKEKGRKEKGKEIMSKEFKESEESERSEVSESIIKTDRDKKRIKKKESTSEESEEEDSTEEESSIKDSAEKEEEDSSVKEKSSEEESSGDSSGDGKGRKFPRKYKKSPRWKQGKTGKYESDPRKLQNKGDTQPSVPGKEKNQFTSYKTESYNNAMLQTEKKNLIKEQEKSPSATKSQTSANVRKAARKFNFFYLSSYPIIRNFMATGESHPVDLKRSSIHSKENYPQNLMSSLKFETPHHIAIQRLHSMPLKPPPEAVSLTNPNLVSRGGENLQNLQSKRTESTLQSTFKDRKLNSIAQEKPRVTLTLISETKDDRKKWTSTGSDHMGNIQSLKVNPIVLTSLAKNIPEVKIDEEEINRTLMKNNANIHNGSTGNDFLDPSEKVNFRVRYPDVLTSIAKHIPLLNTKEKEKKDNFKKGDTSVDESAKKNQFRDKNENVKIDAHQNNGMKQKELQEVNFKMRNSQVGKNSNKTIFKRELNHEQKESSFEELSSIPDSAGVPTHSDEIASASDDRK